MSKSHGGANRQRELYPRSKRPTISIDPNHRLVQLTDTLDWTEMESRVEGIRDKKLKNGAGRPPHLRALLGAVVFMATRRLTYREAEDQIRYYAPARYLCGLTETEWTPDFTTIQDFTELMGEDGVRLLNEYGVELAVEKKLADPSIMVADTTAQEASIPHPNEMGLMASFLRSVTSAGKRAGGAVKGFLAKVAGKFEAAKKKLRDCRLGAKSKTKAAKDRMVSEMTTIVDGIRSALGAALDAAKGGASRLRGYGVVARANLVRLNDTMTKLVPQIRHWLRTGRVASGKIINLYIPELYSIVRGKVGKTVEFGLRWGVARLRGGFLLATVSRSKLELEDARYAVRAVKDHMALFGKPPRAYAYDRGGFSAANVATLKKLGVREVGLAPVGRAAWPVRGRSRERLIHERALVEAGIGSIKSSRYGFNRPAARSAAMMGACGQRAVMGFNLNKLVRHLAERRDAVLVG
jgi:hypothetical protein